MIRKTLFAAAAAMLLSGAAHAQMVTATSPQSLVSALQGAGYKALLSKDSTGDPKISSATSGANFTINFYGCTKNTACKTVTFYAGWTRTKATVDLINDWNKAKRFSRAYIDKDGDPVLEFDVDLDDGGMSAALFIDNIEFWESVVGDFRKHIGA